MPILAASAVFAAVTNATAAASNATATASNATSGAAVGAKAKASSGISNAVLVFDIDLVLLGAVAIFFLLLLPRAAVRFTHKREWVDGHFLRSVYIDGPVASSRVLRRPSTKRPDVISPVSPAYLAPPSRDPDGSSYEHHQYYTEEWGGTTDVSHTYVSHADLIRKGSTASGRERRRQNAPTHMPGVSTVFPATAAFLRKTIRPGLTIGKSIILVCYSAIMLYAGLFRSNPLSEPVRAGFVAVSQIPVIVILGTKNNLVGMLIGFGYERVSSTHVSTARTRV